MVPDRWTAGNDPHLRGLPDRGHGGGGNHAGNPVAGIRSCEPVPADDAADVSSGEVPAWDQLNGFTSTRNRKAGERVPLRYLVVARSSSGSPFRSHLPPGRLIRNDVGLAGVTRQAGHQGVCGVEVRGFNPLTSVRVSGGPPLCRPAFPQLGRNRQGRSWAFWRRRSRPTIPRSATAHKAAADRSPATQGERSRSKRPRGPAGRPGATGAGSRGGQGGLAAWVVEVGAGAPVSRRACSIRRPSRSTARW